MAFDWAKFNNGNLGTHLCGFCAADTGRGEAHTQECIDSRKGEEA